MTIFYQVSSLRFDSQPRQGFVSMPKAGKDGNAEYRLDYSFLKDTVLV